MNERVDPEASRSPSGPARAVRAVGAWASPMFRTEASGAAALVTVSVVMGFFAIVRSAWIGDDAFIAFRAAENLVTGHGLLSNPPERVQAFTSPLWTLLMAAARAVTGELYFTATVVSILISTFTLYWIGTRAALRPAAGVVAVLLLVFSRAFVDYATSGLENPLAHLLLVLFCLEVLKPDEVTSRVRVALFAAAVVLTRLDLALLVLPVCLELLLRGDRRRTLRAALVGLVPLLLWFGFALLYFGFLLPNTAYAKLNIGIPRHLMMAQGFAYLNDSLARDPLLLVTVGTALLLGWRAGNRPVRALLLGVGAQLIYVVSVGGDFMSGRFLTALQVVSVVVLARTVLSNAKSWFLLGATTLFGIVVLSAPSNVFRPVLENCVVPDHGVTDERSCYYEHTGLLRNLHKGEFWTYQTHPYYIAGLKRRDAGERALADNLVGLAGIASGPGVHTIDGAALTDPLLARMRYGWDPTRKWRIGHFYRDAPEGYVASVRDGENRIADPCVAKYYDLLREVTTGPIWSASRFRLIWQMNTRKFDRYLRGRCD